MPSPLDQFGEDQTRRDNADVTGAQKSLSWAETFRSTPPANVLRARANYAEAIDRAFKNKLELQARTDEKALSLLEHTAKFEEYKAQQPLREELLKARVEATGATERRKALEAKTQFEQTARLNEGMAKLYKSGLQPNTPEFQAQAVDILASNPFAHTDHIKELGQAAGFSSELTPEQYVAKAVELKDLAKAKGLANPVIKSFGGHPTVSEGPVVRTPDQVTEDLVHRKERLKSVDAPHVLSPTDQGFLGRYGESVKGVNELLPAIKKVPKGLQSTWDDLAAAAKAGQISEDEARKANHWLNKFRQASGDAGKDDKIEAHFNEVSAKANALQQKAAPAPTGPSKVTSAADFAALPSGAEFIDPQGVKRRKP